MGSRARFIGGPKDGDTQELEIRGESPPDLLRLPVPQRLDLGASLAHPSGDTVDPLTLGPTIAEYRLHLDATGHPSRAEDGAYRYAYRGQRP